jgi:hypothetical protein
MPNQQPFRKQQPAQVPQMRNATPPQESLNIDITSNPRREGLYKLTDSAGRDVNIPYSNVGDALYKGYKIAPSEHSRFVKDFEVDPHPPVTGNEIPFRNAPSMVVSPESGQPMQVKTWQPPRSEAKAAQQQKEYTWQVLRPWVDTKGLAPAQMPISPPLQRPSVPIMKQLDNDIGAVALSPILAAMDPKSTLQNGIDAGDRGANEFVRGYSDGNWRLQNIPNAFSAVAGGDPEAAREEWGNKHYGRAVAQQGLLPALSFASSMIGPGVSEGGVVSPAAKWTGEGLQNIGESMARRTVEQATKQGIQPGSGILQRLGTGLLTSTPGFIGDNVANLINHPSNVFAPKSIAPKLLFGAAGVLKPELQSRFATTLNGLGRGLTEGTGMNGAVRAIPPMFGVGNVAKDEVNQSHERKEYDGQQNLERRFSPMTEYVSAKRDSQPNDQYIGTKPAPEGPAAYGGAPTPVISEAGFNEANQSVHRYGTRDPETEVAPATHCVYVSPAAQPNNQSVGAKLNPEIPISHNSPSPPGGSWRQTLTPRSIPSDATGLNTPNLFRSDLFGPGNSLFSSYPQLPNMGDEAAIAKAPNYFNMPQTSVGDDEQRFQGPPITLKSLAPAAFPSRGTPRTNLYGWTESQ